MTRGFQIWSQKLNKKYLNPFLAKKRSKTGKVPFSTDFLAKRGSNAVRFKFWDQIWNPLVISSLYDTFLLKLSYFEFLSPIVIEKLQMARAVNFFFEFEIFDARFGINVPKDIKMGGVAIALTKILLTTRPTVATALGSKLKSMQHSPVFRE